MKEQYKHIKSCVQYSGGLVSWGAAKMACDEHGAENVLLLFADTGNESDGTYRFMWQGAQALGARLECVRLTGEGGRYIKPWDLAIEKKILPDWHLGICTTELKRKPLTCFIEENLPPECEIVVGFSIEEIERIDRLKKNRPNVNWRFPLAERPYKTMCDIRSWLKELNVEEPDLYEQGFNHANCNGACFKASYSHWARLYKERPEVFAYNEAKEKEWQEKTGKDSTILMYKKEKLSLARLRELVDAGVIQPSYYRLPCACGVIYMQDEFNFSQES